MQTLHTIESGIGIVRNYMMFDHPLKSVVKSPFLSIAHIGTEHWLPASEQPGARLAAGALAGVRAAACRHVCWFDVRSVVRLPPGVWLMRWRVRLVDPRVCPEIFTLRCEAAADDVARVTVTPVPAA